MLLELLRAKGEYILLGDFNLYHFFWGGIAVISTDNMVDDLIYAIETASLSLAIEVGMKMWAKGMLRSILDLVFTSLWITNRLL